MRTPLTPSRRYPLTNLPSAMAVNLEAERARQAKVSAPQRAALEKKRYLEALRCQILEGATQVAANHKGAGAAADKARLLCLCAVGVESGGGG